MIAEHKKHRKHDLEKSSELSENVQDWLLLSWMLHLEVRHEKVGSKKVRGLDILLENPIWRYNSFVFIIVYLWSVSYPGRLLIEINKVVFFTVLEKSTILSFKMIELQEVIVVDVSLCAQLKLRVEAVHAFEWLLITVFCKLYLFFDYKQCEEEFLQQSSSLVLSFALNFAIAKKYLHGEGHSLF